MKNWNVLNKDKSARSHIDKLKDIREALETHETKEPGLLGAAPGLALFWFYLGRALGDEQLFARGMDHITAACTTVEEGFAYPSFAGGLAGLGWTISHLSRQGFIDADLTEVLDDLTEPLHQSMLHYMRSGEYDYLHGALGIALYFLERPDLPETGSILQDVLEELVRQTESDPSGGMRWLSLLNKDTGLKGYNLSLSHGQASIIDILGRMVHCGYGGETAKKALNGATSYLLANENSSTETQGAFFPSWITDEPSEHKGSRLAWCYGDLGIGQALLHTGQRLKNKAWQDKGLAILHLSRKRLDPKEAGILDAGLCHGAAGLGHIYNRLWQETQDQQFAAVARHWFEHLLALSVHGDGPAGYKAFRTPEHGGWVGEMGLLEGVAGIGLALISALYPVEPAWDRLLLLS